MLIVVSFAWDSMGSHRYCYFTPYQADIEAALQSLREAEFKAGRYGQAMRAADPPYYMFELDFPPNADSPAPGPVHATIQAALEDAAGCGTGSILDLRCVTELAGPCSASPVSEDDLRALFGTTQPSREQVESLVLRGQFSGTPGQAISIMSGIGLGEGRYIVVYRAGEANEIFFLGYASD